MSGNNAQRINAFNVPCLVTVIHTGGTLEKIYSELDERMVMGPAEAPSLIELIEIAHIQDVVTVQMDFIDSAAMDKSYRLAVVDRILECKSNRIVIVQGTTTITLTAEYLQERQLEKTIVLTGAVQPARYFPAEGAANFAMALTVARYFDVGVYIAMHGLVERPGFATFDTDRARFQLVRP